MKRSVESFKAGWRAPAPRQPKNWPGSSICRLRRCRERSSALRRTVKHCAAGSGRIVPGKNGVIVGCSHGFTVSRSGDSGEKSSRSRRRIVPTSLSPISLFPREDAEWLLRTAGNGASSLPVSPLAEDIHRFIQTRGASFFTDIVKGTGHLSSEVEQGLWELVAAGSVSADGFDNRSEERRVG